MTTPTSDRRDTAALSHWERVGPSLRYTNDRAREMEESVESFSRMVNDDLHALLKWAASLNCEIDRLREWIDTEGRNCPSSAAVDVVLGSPSIEEA